MGDESIMSNKEHGSTKHPVQANLRWKVDRQLADRCALHCCRSWSLWSPTTSRAPCRICCFNRHFAEPATSWERSTFLADLGTSDTPIEFYDSVSGKLLFTAPIGRSADEFVKESKVHGWPSFRDSEVNWDYVRILPDGETVCSTWGSHGGVRRVRVRHRLCSPVCPLAR